MFIKTESNNAYQASNGFDRRSKRAALYLLSLPRPAKCSLLFGIDFAVSNVCLLLALSLRYGYIDLHIGIAAQLFYAFIPVASLYLIGFYRGASRGFFDALMSRVLQLFLLLSLIHISEPTRPY